MNYMWLCKIYVHTCALEHYIGQKEVTDEVIHKTECISCTQYSISKPIEKRTVLVRLHRKTESRAECSPCYCQIQSTLVFDFWKFHTTTDSAVSQQYKVHSVHLSM